LPISCLRARRHSLQGISGRPSVEDGRAEKTFFYHYRDQDYVDEHLQDEVLFPLDVEYQKSTLRARRLRYNLNA
jgi:hypothetical protein